MFGSKVVPCQTFLHRRRLKKAKNSKSVLVITSQPKVQFYVWDRILKALGMFFKMSTRNMDSDCVLRLRFEKTAKNQIPQKKTKKIHQAV